MYKVILSLLIITGLSLISFQATAFKIKDKELLIYFSFDGDKGQVVEDLGPNKNDGEVVGKVEFVEGKVGNAAKFSQAGEIKAPMFH